MTAGSVPDDDVVPGRLLELDGRGDSGVFQRCGAVGNDDEFVVVIVESVDDRDAVSVCREHRFGRAQVISVEFFSVGRECAGDVAVVGEIAESAGRVTASGGSIDVAAELRIEPGAAYRYGWPAARVGRLFGGRGRREEPAYADEDVELGFVVEIFQGEAEGLNRALGADR